MSNQEMQAQMISLACDWYLLWGLGHHVQHPSLAVRAGHDSHCAETRVKFEPPPKISWDSQAMPCTLVLFQW